MLAMMMIMPTKRRNKGVFIPILPALSLSLSVVSIFTSSTKATLYR